MLEVFRIVGNVVLDTSEALTGLRTVQNRANRVGEVLKKAGDNIQNFGRKMTMFATLPIVAGLAGSVKAASDLNETLSKTEVVFKNGTREVLDWSDNTLKSIGLAKMTALDMAAVYGDMGTGMGLAGKEAQKMSINLVNLTGDMASFKNMRPDEIHIALSGVYTGETEALKRLGIVMTVANLESFALSQGIKKQYKEMTQAEKIALRYDFIMNSAKNSIGDFARTQDSAANQTRIFTESIKEVGAKIGTIILPYFTAVVKVLNKLVDRFNEAPPVIQKITLVISLLVAAIGPMLVGFGMAISAIGTLTTVFAALSWPVIGIIAGVTAFTTVVVGSGIAMIAAAKKSGVLKQGIKFLKDVFEIFRVALTGKFVDAVDLVEKKFGVSRTEAWKFVLKITELRAAFFELVRKLKSGSKEGFGYLVDYTKKASSWLVRHKSDILKVIQTVVEMAIKFVQSTQKIGSNIMKIIRWGKDFNKNMTNISKSIVKTITNIKLKFDGLINSAFFWGINLIRNFINGIKLKANSLKSVIASIPATIARYIGFKSPAEEGPGSEADKWPINFMDMFIDGLKAKIPQLLQTVSDISAGLKIDPKLNFLNGISKNFNPGIVGNKNGEVVNINMNYPNFTSDQNVNEIMNNVKEVLQDWINYKKG